MTPLMQRHDAQHLKHIVTTHNWVLVPHGTIIEMRIIVEESLDLFAG
jgi:hypothetical protein